MPEMSASWNPSVPIRLVDTWPVIATTGTRVHVGVRERRDQVGRARPAGRHADPDPAGRLRVAGRRVPGALLVADQDVPDLSGVEQRVVGGQHGAARDAEHHLDADLLHGQDQGLRPGDPALVAALPRAPGPPRGGLGRLGGPVGAGPRADAAAGCPFWGGRLQAPGRGLRGGGCAAVAVRRGAASRAGWAAARGRGWPWLAGLVRRRVRLRDWSSARSSVWFPGLECAAALKNPSCQAAVEGRAQKLPG